MHGTLFRPGLWHCEVRVSTVPGEDLSRRCILGQENHQRDQDQCELNLDSTQRPLQGAFLIPPVLPVVLIRVGRGRHVQNPAWLSFTRCVREHERTVPAGGDFRSATARRSSGFVDGRSADFRIVRTGDGGLAVVADPNADQLGDLAFGQDLAFDQGLGQAFQLIAVFIQ